MINKKFYFSTRLLLETNSAAPAQMQDLKHRPGQRSHHRMSPAAGAYMLYTGDIGLALPEKIRADVGPDERKCHVCSLVFSSPEKRRDSSG